MDLIKRSYFCLRKASKSVHSFLVRFVLALLLIVGVFVGTVGRASSYTHVSCEISECGEPATQCEDRSSSKSECCPSEGIVKSSGSKDTDEQNHTEHHHHHICCGMPSLITNDDKRVGFIGLDGIRTGLSMEHSVAPENPVFELDTPPLI